MLLRSGNLVIPRRSSLYLDSLALLLRPNSHKVLVVGVAPLLARVHGFKLLFSKLLDQLLVNLVDAVVPVGLCTTFSAEEVGHMALKLLELLAGELHGDVKLPTFVSTLARSRRIL